MKNVQVAPRVPTTFTPVIAATWEMVNAGHDEIGWSPDGSRIVVHSTEGVAARCFMKYLGHSSYDSWRRRLNSNKFCKEPPAPDENATADRWYHPDFHRDAPPDFQRMAGVKRRSPSGRRSGANKTARRTTVASISPPQEVTASLSDAGEGTVVTAAVSKTVAAREVQDADEADHTWLEQAQVEVADAKKETFLMRHQLVAQFPRFAIRAEQLAGEELKRFVDDSFNQLAACLEGLGAQPPSLDHIFCSMCPSVSFQRLVIDLEQQANTELKQKIAAVTGHH